MSERINGVTDLPHIKATWTTPNAVAFKKVFDALTDDERTQLQNLATRALDQAIDAFDLHWQEEVSNIRREEGRDDAVLDLLANLSIDLTGL